MADNRNHVTIIIDKEMPHPVELLLIDIHRGSSPI